MKNMTSLPTSQDILNYLLRQNLPLPRQVLAQAFSIKGEQRRDLRVLLKDMSRQGLIDMKGKVIFSVISADKKPRASTQVIKKTAQRVIEDPSELTGIIERHGRFYYLISVEKNRGQQVRVDSESMRSIKANVGDLVKAKAREGHKGCMLISVVCPFDKLQRHFSQIAIEQYELPHTFSAKALSEADNAKSPSLDSKRVDLRQIPLVTIDDMEARDHDDAVYAEPDLDQNNKGGWRILVAIADVSHYVKIESALDREAQERANSTYFPDQVVPMLPEKLSNDLCSLKQDQDRYCLAVWLTIDSQGKLIGKEFFNGLMRSHGKLTYQGVQACRNGDRDHLPDTLDLKVIDHLYGAYQALCHDRRQRGVLEIDLPEYKIIFNPDGSPQMVSCRQRLDAHRLIEEMMILANVAAAQLISEKNHFAPYRIHSEPQEEKIEEFRNFLKSHNLSLTKGRVHQKDFNQCLKKAQGHQLEFAIGELVLRCQSQARYFLENEGHYGLNLSHYAHFTSPIRRYADLVIHRILKNILSDKNNPQLYTKVDLEKICDHLSLRERLSTKAERDTINRYVANLYQKKVGTSLRCQVRGISNFALFLSVEDSGCDGILPLRNLKGDYFSYDPASLKVVGKRTQTRLGMGDKIEAHLEESSWASGGLVFSVTIAGKAPASPKKKMDKKSLFKKQTPRRAKTEPSGAPKKGTSTTSPQRKKPSTRKSPAPFAKKAPSRPGRKPL